MIPFSGDVSVDAIRTELGLTGNFSLDSLPFARAVWRTDPDYTLTDARGLGSNYVRMEKDLVVVDRNISSQGFNNFFYMDDTDSTGFSASFVNSQVPGVLSSVGGLVETPALSGVEFPNKRWNRNSSYRVDAGVAPGDYVITYRATPDATGISYDFSFVLRVL